ncbi:MAG: transglutaminase domain-containing protein [Bilifractor sp.]|jgi:uncharacterized protein YjdB
MRKKSGGRKFLAVLAGAAIMLTSVPVYADTTLSPSVSASPAGEAAGQSLSGQTSQQAADAAADNSKSTVSDPSSAGSDSGSVFSDSPAAKTDSDLSDSSSGKNSSSTISADSSSVTDTPESIVSDPSSAGDNPESAVSSSSTADNSGDDPAEKELTASDGQESGPSVVLQTHVQRIGWQSAQTAKTDGTAASGGVTGRSLRLEALRLQVNGDENLGIQYQTYVQNIGWQNAVSDGAVAGTSGRSLRIEALKIRLTGDDASSYHIWYRVHVQRIGWLAWASDDEISGTMGASSRIEAIQVQILPADQTPSASGSSTTHSWLSTKDITYRTHVQKIGWQSPKSNGEVAGTVGRSLRIEAFRASTSAPGLGVSYRSYIQNSGWESDWHEGDDSGSTGKSLRLEAIQMKLTGDAAQYFDIYYRVQVQHFGWLGWASNGASAGTENYGYRVEAIQVAIRSKVQGAPGGTAPAFREMPKVRQLYPLACQRLDQVGWNLRSAMNAAAGMAYVSTSYSLTAANVSTIAAYGFTTGGGDCYVMACCFYEMAKALGYDAHVMFGYVPLLSGGLGVHSWVEIDNYEGTTRVFDPDFQHESHNDGFNLYYGKPGTWRYTNAVRIN